MSKTLPVPEDIDVSAPYFVERFFKSDLTHDGTRGRNLSATELEAFRSASEKYVAQFLKKGVLVSTDECLVSKEGDVTIKVKMYCFPEVKSDESETQEQTVGSDKSSVSEEKLKELKKKKSLMRKAIKLAKEYSYSDGVDVHTSFYDKYVFTRGWGGKLELKGERERVYEDAATLTELMPAFETYARLFNENYVVISKDNCVAATPQETIYLVLFNIPTQEKKKRVTKRSKPVTNDIPTAEESVSDTNTSPIQGVRDLILKAVKMADTLPVANGTDTSAPYFVQHDFSVTYEGELILTGKPYSQNISIETLDKYKTNHRKYARAMKASYFVSTDTYTAFIQNNGKKVCVYSYHV